MTDKPARLISKLLDSLRAKEADLATTRRDLKAMTEQKELFFQRSSEAHDRIATLTLRNSLLEREFTLVPERVQDAVDVAVQATLADASVRLASVQAALDAAMVKNTELRGELDGLSQAREVIAAQRAELTCILDSVRVRLRKKEVEEERAILNRQTVAGARPGLNRR